MSVMGFQNKLYSGVSSIQFIFDFFLNFATPSGDIVEIIFGFFQCYPTF